MKHQGSFNSHSLIKENLLPVPYEMKKDNKKKCNMQKKKIYTQALKIRPPPKKKLFEPHVHASTPKHFSDTRS